MTARPSWEEYALKLAFIASERSSDPWKKVGCCILRHDNSIASLGYNGEPKGQSIDWSNRDERRKRVIHAEQNGTRYIKPGECYLCATTIAPCLNCIKLLASYGISVIVFKDIYKEDTFGLELAKEFGMKIIQLSL
jgi:dCMP deaminase